MNDVVFNKDENKPSYVFKINVNDIEKIVSLYKERDENYLDIKYFINHSGVSNLLSLLDTSSTSGISTSSPSFSERESHFGSNQIIQTARGGFCDFVLESLDDLMVRVLICAAILQIVLGATLSENKTDWIDGLSIIFAILVVVFVGSITNYRKEMKFKELNEIKEEGTKHTVIRDGESIELSNDNLLVGDLVIVNYGEIIPADMLLIEGRGLKIDESALTGESETMKKASVEECIKIFEKKNFKNLPSPIILSGTNCIEGTGKAIVLAVGEHSLKGIIRRIVDNSRDNTKTPLEEKLETIAQMIGYFGIFAGIITLIALFIRFLVSYKLDKVDFKRDAQVKGILTGFIQNVQNAKTMRGIISRTNNKLTDPRRNIPKNILDIVILCISIIVVAIPEGLPLAVTLSLAFSVKKLMDFNNLVRKMQACETMGGANYICTDKTGTLTKNQMNICMVLTGNGIMNLNKIKDIEGIGDIEKDNNINSNIEIESPKNYFKNDKYWNELKTSILLNIPYYNQSDCLNNEEKNKENQISPMILNVNKNEQTNIDTNHNQKINDKINSELLSINTKNTHSINANKTPNSNLFNSKDKNSSSFPVSLKNNSYNFIKKTSVSSKNKNSSNTISQAQTNNKTDTAFLNFLLRFGVDVSLERNYEKIIVFPFDSKKKRMSSMVKNKNFPTGYRMFTKGGAENSLNFCKYFLDPETGEKKTITDDNLSFIKQSMEYLNCHKLRSLYVAFKDISEEEFLSCDNTIEQENDIELKLLEQKNMVFIGVFGMKDQLREGVKEAVLKCKEASVKVIMVTGDNIITATAIAKECNILGKDVDMENLTSADIEEEPELINDPNNRSSYISKLLSNPPRAITGSSFFAAIDGLKCEICLKSSIECRCPKTEAEAQAMSRQSSNIKKVKKDAVGNIDNFRRMVKRLRVMARSQPIHKYALVVGLKALKNVVAVTGDGTNDAPALSKSDVGFSMFDGTDIAKEASDIVILDNNFASIVVAIIYGRNIYDNIRKFLQFQLTVNFSACILVFICGCIGNETPLTPIQMLWVNLIMDSLGSLALATETPYTGLLKRKPTRRNESIINGKMWKHIIFQCISLLSILLIFYLHAPKFITESNIKRLSENYIIRACYDSMPGGTEPNYIIYGTKDRWTASINIKDSIDHMDCGLYRNYQNLSVAYKLYISATGSTTHMTLIFNVFVIYTLFNQINSRILDDSLNIFKRLDKSFPFIVITLCELGLQILIISVGNEFFHVVEDGLTIEQWLISFGFSCISFAISILVKFIPVDKALDKLLDRNLENNADNYDLDEDEDIIDGNNNENLYCINNVNVIDGGRNDNMVNQIMKKERKNEIKNNQNNDIGNIEPSSNRGLRDVSGSTILRLSENGTPISLGLGN